MPKTAVTRIEPVYVDRLAGYEVKMLSGETHYLARNSKGFWSFRGEMTDRGCNWSEPMAALASLLGEANARTEAGGESERGAWPMKAP